MMTTVWVIETGEYSDYRVEGVFSTKERAEAVNAKVGGEVSEWPLDPAFNELKKGYSVFLGEMLRDGTVERCISWDYEVTPRMTIWRRSQAPAYVGKNVPDCLHGTVWAKDSTHAIKIMNEKRTQMIAMGEWP